MFSGTDILSIKPFEVCSIRPPTENSSLSFRLTRNCYWNKCAFCPVYKLGAHYSKRSIDEVLEDIIRAKRMDDYLFEQGIGYPVYSTAAYGRIPELADAVKAAQWEAGIFPDPPDEETRCADDLDPRMAWFLTWFNSRPGIAECMNHLITWRINGGRTCFLGDADSLNLKPDFIFRVISAVRLQFPSISRFTVYGRTSTAARMRSVKELRSMADAGLHRVHFGLESGSDNVLSLVNKGVTAEEHVKGCLKTKEAGLSCSVYVMPGLGGAAFSEEHAHDTARVLTQIAPDFIRLRSLEVFPMTGLADALRDGLFIEANEEQVVREIRTLVEEIDVDTEILSDSASNLLSIYGTLPRDRGRMLGEIDGYLSLGRREKLEYSVTARLQSFIDQYGEPTDDILSALGPCIENNKLDFSALQDSSLEELIRLIRMKLMP
jgi:radical SAM superfamily enzyme YgiQ (UPF0313 family)